MNASKPKILTKFPSVLIFLLLFSSGYAQEVEPQAELPELLFSDESGKFEVSLHFSMWTVDVIKGAFEDKLNDELGEEIGNKVTKTVRGDYNPAVVVLDSEVDLAFDSGGYTYGLELRYYPKGKDGSFSLGLAFDKARMRLTEQGNVRQDFQGGTFATAEGKAEIILNPWFTTLSVRWDVKPRWIVSPYFVMGLGVAALNGEVNYDYSGEYNSTVGMEPVEGSEQKTIKEAEEDMSVNIPNVLPLLQLNIGVRAEIMRFLNLKAEAGFWDGFLLRFGISGRF